LFSAIFLLSGLPTQFPLELANLMIVASFIGLFFSTLTFVSWHILSNTSPIIKFRNYISY